MKKVLLFILTLSILTVCIAPAALAVNEDDFTCGAAVLMEAETGKVLFEKEKDEELAMASITKLMLLLIAMERMEEGKLSLDDTVVGSPKAKEVGGSTMYLDVGEKMTVDDVLKGICISSANDGAIALAETIAGSEDDFVKLMNTRAEEMGLKNTHYVNVTGLDAEKHYTSAYDVAVLSREIITKHPKILEYSSKREEWLRGKKTQLLNTNKLFSRYQYTTGLKTGTETNAKYCVSATAEKDGMKLIAVILGAPTDGARFSEAQKLLEYGYDSYELSAPVESGEQAGTVTVKKGKADFVTAVAPKAVKVVVPKTYSNKIKKEVSLEEEIEAPIAKGTKLGTMTIKAGGDDVEKIELVAAEDIPKLTFFQAVFKVIKSIFAF